VVDVTDAVRSLCRNGEVSSFHEHEATLTVLFHCRLAKLRTRILSSLQRTEIVANIFLIKLVECRSQRRGY